MLQLLICKYLISELFLQFFQILMNAQTMAMIVVMMRSATIHMAHSHAAVFRDTKEMADSVMVHKWLYYHANICLTPRPDYVPSFYSRKILKDMNDCLTFFMVSSWKATKLPKQFIVCLDENECKAGTHSCDANAQCSNTIGSFTCTCLKGFSGNGLVCSGKFLFSDLD